MNKSKEIENTKKASEPTLKRLPIFLHYLNKVKQAGVLNISAPSIGKDLKCDATQVVKDLSVTGVKGKPKVGYNVYELTQAIENYLGFNKSNEAFLIGAGNLGSALLSYPELKSFGLKIVAAFDVDKDKVNSRLGSINILDMSKLKDLAERLKIKIAILTTPPEVSQEVAELLTENGVRAIWNLTPVSLDLPNHVVVQNTSMYSNVAVLLKRFHESDQ